MSQNYIYIGQTIPPLGIRRNMLVIGPEPPVQIKNLMALKPICRSLYIPTNRLAEARKNLQIEGSLEHMAFVETHNYRIQLHEESRAKQERK